MAQYGLGNFIYEVQPSNDGAAFKFWDQDDGSNTAEVTVSAKDFPAGISQPDSREVAEIAFSQVSKQLNDKRDARLVKEAGEATQSKIDEDARTREAADELRANSQDVATEPAKVEKDGTRVFNTADAKDAEETKSDTSKK